jgi:hypothetical protein
MRVGKGRWLFLLLFGLAPLTAHGQARAKPNPPASTAVKRLAGCYRLVAEDSDRTSKDAQTKAREELPDRFELVDTALAYPLDGLYALRPATLLPPQAMFAVWRPVGSDSVTVSWSTGFHGIGLEFAVRGDTLAGRQARFSDARPRGQPEPRGTPVLATRVSCETR